MEHCISTLNFRLKQEFERKSFEVYVTDALMGISENTTHIGLMSGVVDVGRTMTKRWLDMLEPQEEVEQPEDPRPCEEIAADIWDRMRGN